MARGADVIVVGAGAMGSAAAWWLARRGRSVLVLERFEQGHVRGSSHGTSRIFRVAYPAADYVRLAREAGELWRELEDESGVSLLTTTGGVDHGDPAEIEPCLAAMRSVGVGYEQLAAEAAAERWPGMRFDGDVVFQPDAGRVHADDAVRVLQDAAARHGAELRFGEGAEEIVVDGDTAAVRTAAGEHRAPVAVVTCGAWATPVLGESVSLPPLLVTKEQVFHFVARDDATAWPCFIHHRTPVIYGLDAPGEGVKVAEHHTGTEVDPDRRTFDVDEAGRARVASYVAEWFPGLEPEPVLPLTCLYTTTPTEDFVLDRRGPLVIGAGFSGHGFKFTPAIGRILGDLVEGGGAPAARFSLDR